MSNRIARTIRKAVRREYMHELREYYRLPLHTRLKVTIMILFAIRPKREKNG